MIIITVIIIIIIISNCNLIRIVIFIDSLEIQISGNGSVKACNGFRDVTRQRRKRKTIIGNRNINIPLQEKNYITDRMQKKKNVNISNADNAAEKSKYSKMR